MYWVSFLSLQETVIACLSFIVPNLVYSLMKPIDIQRGSIVAFASTSFLVLLASLPPFVAESGRSILMDAFSIVCHQLPSRSPHIDGVPLAVCHRCYATYLGFPIAALLFRTFRGAWPFSVRSAPWMLGLAVLPAVVDWGGDVVGIWQNSVGSRMVTGGIMGVAAGYFLVAAIADMVSQKRTSGSQHKESTP